MNILYINLQDQQFSFCWYIKYECFLRIHICLPAADMKTGEGAIYEGAPKNVKADCTIVISDDDMVDLVSGKLNGQQVGKYMSDIVITMW